MAQFVVSMYRDVRSTWMPTSMVAAPTLRSSTTSDRIWNLTNSFGSMVLRTILTGFMFLSFVMALIVVAASRLVETTKAKLILKLSLAKDSKRNSA